MTRRSDRAAPSFSPDPGPRAAARATVSRRATLAGLGAVALAPGAGFAQQSGEGYAAFLARCRAVSGFSIIPRELVEPLREALGDEVEDRALAKALYTGVIAAEDERALGRRVAYPLALQWAAVEGWVNTPSFCGGLPGFWAYPPEVV